MINSATLPFLLKQLQLKTMQTSWEEMSMQAEKLHWTYPVYLTALCDNLSHHQPEDIRSFRRASAKYQSQEI